VYLDEVDRCGIYLGLFGKEYGPGNSQGLSATEREIDRATAAGKTRLIYLMGKEDGVRHRKMVALIRKAGPQLIRRRITGGVPQLTKEVLASLVEHLERQGAIEHRAFEERPCPGGALDGLDGEAVAAFVRRARSARQFPLAEGTPVADVLTHLHLLADGGVSNAAVLLFGRDPQKFVPCAEIRCMHFHGTVVQRPAPFYRVFKGRLFDQVDQAADFVLSKVNLSVGTRAAGPRAPVRSELPKDVVTEAIVNAVAHRDDMSGAAVQVSVFADRVEVWNPGALLPPLTPESLREPHRSVLRNPRIAEVLFLAQYIEKYGTGTLMMIRESLGHALPEPSFGGNQPGEFGTTIWRDWLTDEVMAGFGLNDRQRSAIAFLKTRGRISNPEYQEVAKTTKKTSSRDLADLRRKGIVEQTGIRGRGVHYVLAGMGTRRGQWGHGPAGSGNGDTMGTMGTSGARNSDDDELAKGAIKGPKGPPAARGRRTGTRAKGGRR
jgi:predicted HTH transcriptional regulator